MRSKVKLYAAFTIAMCASVIGHISVHLAANKDDAAQIAATNLYMACDAIMICLLISCVWMLSTGLFKRITGVLLFLAFSKVLDELLFDPLTYHWNDILSFNIAMVLITAMITKHYCYDKPHR